MVIHEQIEAALGEVVSVVRHRLLWAAPVVQPARMFTVKCSTRAMVQYKASTRSTGRLSPSSFGFFFD